MMAVKSSFVERLKKLRGPLDVASLAKLRGVSMPTIYKAESGERNVKWQTIEAIYGDFCQSPSELGNLLMLWALSQTDREISMEQTAESMGEMLSENARVILKESKALLREFEQMSPLEQREMVQFAHKFRKSQPTRDMVRAWMKAIKETE